MKYTLSLTKAILFVSSFLILFSCSKEFEDMPEASQDLISTVETNTREIGKNPGTPDKIEYLSPGHEEYQVNMELLLNEGAAITTDQVAIKTINANDHIAYYFQGKEANQYFGTIYMRGEYKGALSYMGGLDENEKYELIVSNLSADRSVNIFSGKSIFHRLPVGSGGADRTFAECVSESTAWVFYNTLTLPPPAGGIANAYINSVIAVNGIVVYCAGEAAVCWLIDC